MLEPKVEEKSLRTYVRNGQGKRIGVMVAVPREDDTVGIGWAKCHWKDRTKIELVDIDGEETVQKRPLRVDKDKLLSIAVGRAKKGICKDKVPWSLQDEMEKFMLRAAKYYKDKQVLEVEFQERGVH